MKQRLRRLASKVQPVIDRVDHVAAKPPKKLNDYIEQHWSYARPIPPVHSIGEWCRREATSVTKVVVVAVIALAIIISITIWAFKVLL